jgi:hypothetical protein
MEHPRRSQTRPQRHHCRPLRLHSQKPERPRHRRLLLTVNHIQELDKIDPIFLAAVTRSYKPIKGELKLQIDDNIVQNRLRLATQRYLARLKEGLKTNEYRPAVLLNAFNAARYASWLLLHQYGLPLPNNTTEIITLLKQVAPETLQQLNPNQNQKKPQHKQNQIQKLKLTTHHQIRH